MRRFMTQFIKQIHERRKELSIGLIITVLYAVPRIPYINLLRVELICGISGVAIFWAVGCYAKKLFIIAVVLCLLLLLFSIIGDGEMIEYLGGTIYFILAAACFVSIYEFKLNAHE